MNKLKAFVIIGILLVSTASQAALIRITPQGVAVADQPITHPVPIGDDGFRLSFHGGGSSIVLDPLVLIFATPDTTPDGSAPMLTASGDSNPGTLTAGITLGGANVYGGSWDSLTGDAGNFDSTDSGSVYADIGFANAGGSQNYTNWNSMNGDTSWDLWVYTITFNPDFSQGDWIEFDTTNLAQNSFVVGYGCTTLNTAGDACRNSGSAQDTPFTFAGYVTTVPEPASLLIFAIGLLGLGFGRKRLGRRT